MSTKWKYYPLEEIAEIHDDKRRPINSKDRAGRTNGKQQSQLYPYYGATGQVGWIDDYLSDDEYVLLGEDGAPFLNPYADKAYIINGKAWVNNHAHILRSKGDNRFLCYYLNLFDYKGYVSGTTRLKLTQGSMRKIPVPNPPINVQQQIVSHIEELFSDLDDGVATLEKTKKELELYRQSVLENAFSKAEQQVMLSRLIDGKPQNGIYKPKKDYGSGTRILRIDGFYDGAVVDGYRFKRVKLSDEEIATYKLNIGDIVVNRVNSMPYLGKCALIDDLQDETVFESNMMRFSIKNEICDPKYVVYFLTSYKGRRQLTKNAKQAVNQASINQKDVGAALIPLKSLNEQRKVIGAIEERLSVCDEISTSIDTALQQASSLRQSILKKAFEGELVRE